ncbi:ALA-interacting subunit 1 [Hordeum vulgare]|nr:ALA-interacting subunit 1 [Hordeum vulgare]
MVQSNELMVAKTLEAKKELVEKKAQAKKENWQLLKEEGLLKTAIEERKAEENKALTKLLAEENKIMNMNRNDMDAITKEWHDMARKDILKRRIIVVRSNRFNAGGEWVAVVESDDVDDDVHGRDGGFGGGTKRL